MRTDTDATRQVTARGLVFDVTAGGPVDGPAVLLLHGFPQHAGEWAEVTAPLHAAGLRTYALDQRGYSPGARPAEVAAYRTGELVADAVAVLDAVEAPTAHVVGHDWGAVVAWRLAAEYPDRVATLTAVSVPHPGAFAYALATDADQRRRSSYMELFAQEGKAEQVLLAGGAATLRGMLTGVGGPDRVDAYAEPMRAPGALTAALNWYRANSFDDLGRVGPVRQPTTFVWSDGDVAVGRTAAEACARHVEGDYRFVELSGVTHWVPDEAPEAVAEAVLHRAGRREGR